MAEIRTILTIDEIKKKLAEEYNAWGFYVKEESNNSISFEKN